MQILLNTHASAPEVERLRDKVHIAAFANAFDHLSKGGLMPKALAATAMFPPICLVIDMANGKATHTVVLRRIQYALAIEGKANRA